MPPILLPSFPPDTSFHGASPQVGLPMTGVERGALGQEGGGCQCWGEGWGVVALGGWSLSPLPPKPATHSPLVTTRDSVSPGHRWWRGGSSEALLWDTAQTGERGSISSLRCKTPGVGCTKDAGCVPRTGWVSPGWVGVPILPHPPCSLHSGLHELLSNTLPSSSSEMQIPLGWGEYFWFSLRPNLAPVGAQSLRARFNNENRNGAVY